MEKGYTFIACDCGNSSVRVMLCRFDGERISIEKISGHPNRMVAVGDHFYWDILYIFDLLKEGIRQAVKRTDRVHSLGVCTWGVDFALFDEGGFMLNNPLSYRNKIGEAALNRLGQAQQDGLFFKTGIVSDKINSLYMIKGMQEAMGGLTGAGKKLLMIPDILNYFLTGVMENEPSEISTTQLFDASRMEISREVCAEMGVPYEWFSTIGRHGTRIANLRPSLKEELGLAYDIPVVCVPSHDTACAVLGTPACEEEFAFISSGTWTLIGAQCPRPVVTQEVLNERFTNEVGAFGRITLLKNSIGMYIHQRLRQEYEAYAGHAVSWDQLNALAKGDEGEPPLFNVNHPDFFNPPHMAEAIWEYLLRTGQVQGGLDWGVVMRAFPLSMAASYAQGIRQTEKAAGRQYDRVYLVGGGSKNTNITQFAADMTGKEFFSCHAECASMGNAAAQLKYAMPGLTFAQLKEIVTRSQERAHFTPASDMSCLLARYEGLPG